MNDPAVAIMIVNSKIWANFLKNLILVNSITTADEPVVNAAASIDGPILVSACLVRFLLLTLPTKLT